MGLFSKKTCGVCDVVIKSGQIISDNSGNFCYYMCNSCYNELLRLNNKRIPISKEKAKEIVINGLTTEYQKYGDDYYMQCDLCKYIFHYTQQDLLNDAKAELEAAKQQMAGGLNMMLGNAYMGQRDVHNAEEKSSRIVDRNKCPKCGNSKLIRLTEEEAKAEIEKQNAPTPVVAEASAADELKKFKELLDMGVITQEEFDAKKKQLLGL